jgi:hypothetical protein
MRQGCYRYEATIASSPEAASRVLSICWAERSATVGVDNRTLSKSPGGELTDRLPSGRVASCGFGPGDRIRCMPAASKALRNSSITLRAWGGPPIRLVKTRPLSSAFTRGNQATHFSQPTSTDCARDVRLALRQSPCSRGPRPTAWTPSARLRRCDGRDGCRDSEDPAMNCGGRACAGPAVPAEDLGWDRSSGSR